MLEAPWLLLLSASSMQNSEYNLSRNLGMLICAWSVNGTHCMAEGSQLMEREFYEFLIELEKRGLTDDL